MEFIGKFKTEDKNGRGYIGKTLGGKIILPPVEVPGTYWVSGIDKEKVIIAKRIKKVKNTIHWHNNCICGQTTYTKTEEDIVNYWMNYDPVFIVKKILGIEIPEIYPWREGKHEKLVIIPPVGILEVMEISEAWSTGYESYTLYIIKENIDPFKDIEWGIAKIRDDYDKIKKFIDKNFQRFLEKHIKERWKVL